MGVGLKLWTFECGHRPEGNVPEGNIATSLASSVFLHTIFMSLVDFILAGFGYADIAENCLCESFGLPSVSPSSLDAHGFEHAIMRVYYARITMVTAFLQYIRTAAWPALYFALNRSDSLSRYEFAGHKALQIISQRRVATPVPHSKVQDSMLSSGKTPSAPLIPNGLDQKSIRDPKLVFNLVIESRSSTFHQVSREIPKCSEASVSVQYPRAQVQDGQSTDAVHNPGKRTHSRRRGSDDEDDENTINRKKMRTSSLSEAKRLACPFYRNDPKSHGKHRSCAGPGWTTTHRVKQHILRQHALPIHCPRCLRTFITDAECKLHLRQAVLCLLSDSPPPEGYNKEQETLLRTKSRGNPEREWRAMYNVLFPGVPEELIPSPYYDDDEMQLELLQRRESNRFQKHMELAVPRSVVRLLGQTTFEPSVSLDAPMRTQLVEIVTSAVAEASQSYRQREHLQTETQELAVSNAPSGFVQQPDATGIADNVPFLAISPHMHGLFQTQADLQQPSVAEYSLDHSTSVHGGMQHQDNDSRPGHGFLVDPSILDMTFFDWNPDQHTPFQNP